MKVVVIGGGAAGMSSASRIKRINHDAEVTVFESGRFVSHAPCGIPYFIEGFSRHLEDLTYYSPEFFIKNRKINVKTNSRVIEIDSGSVVVDCLGQEIREEWDYLVIATGASPRRLGIPGEDLDGVYTVDVIEDGYTIREELKHCKDVVVVGASYVEIELAEALVSLNKNVIVIEREPQVLPSVDQDIASIMERELRVNMDVRLNETVEAIEGTDRVETVITDKEEYKADMVILATGVKPNVELARHFGVEIGKTGAIKTHSTMETSVENVYAAGDCAQTIHMISGEEVWYPLAPTANKMGYVAGSNIAGRYMEFPGVLGTTLTKFFDLQLGKTGFNEREAREHGFEPVSVTIETKTRPRYYPGGKEILVKLIASPTGKLLGAQIIGYEMVPGRVRTAAALIQKGGTVEDLFFADLAYSPPFGPVWDPLVIAARQLMKKLDTIT